MADEVGGAADTRTGKDDDCAAGTRRAGAGSEPPCTRGGACTPARPWRQAGALDRAQDRAPHQGPQGGRGARCHLAATMTFEAASLRSAFLKK